MIRIAICEDDRAAARHIEQLIADYRALHPGILEPPQLFTSGGELIKHSRHNQLFDIYLLDIVMPEMTGMEVARHLRELDKNVTAIFLTASPDFALDAYRVGAMQYLVKPVQETELFAALDQALRLTSKTTPKSILVNTVKGKMNIALSSIVYVECRNHILTYHLADGSALPGRTIRTSFEVAMAPLLEERNFLHPHKSFIINADYVERLTSQLFIMQGGWNIPITKSRYSQSRSRYLQYFDLTGT